MNTQVLLETLTAPIKSGYLKKRGAKAKGFKKRWFVLEGGYLFYFKSNSHKEKSAGIIQLAGGSVIKSPEVQSAGEMGQFDVVTPHRTYHIECPDLAQVEEWKTVLRSVASSMPYPINAPAPSNPEYKPAVSNITEEGVPLSLSQKYSALEEKCVEQEKEMGLLKSHLDLATRNWTIEKQRLEDEVASLTNQLNNLNLTASRQVDPQFTLLKHKYEALLEDYNKIKSSSVSNSSTTSSTPNKIKIGDIWVDDSFKSSIRNLQSRASTKQWCLLTYSPNPGSKFKIRNDSLDIETGSGNISECRTFIKSEFPAYGFFYAKIGTSRSIISFVYLPPPTESTPNFGSPNARKKVHLHFDQLHKYANNISSVGYHVNIDGVKHSLNDVINSDSIIELATGKKPTNLSGVASTKSRSKIMAHRGRRSSDASSDIAFLSRRGAKTGSIVLADEKKFQSSVEAVASGIDGSPQWVLFGYQEGSNNVVTEYATETDSSGIPGIAETVSDHVVLYGIVRIIVKDAFKMLFISWVGPQAKPLIKARSSMHRNKLLTLMDKFCQVHGEFQILVKDDISEQLFWSKISGSKLRTNPKATEANRSSSRPVSASSSGKRGNAAKEMSIEDTESFFDTLGKVEKNKLSWILFGLKQSDPNVVCITASGNDDGVDAYKTLLKPDQAQFIFVSTTFMSSKKHLFVTWVGASAPPAHRGRSTLYRKLIYDKIDTVLKLHGEIQWIQSSPDDFSIVSREEYAHKLTGSKLRSDVEETSGPGPTATGHGTAAKKMSLENEEQLRETLDKVGKNSLAWILFSLKESDPNVVCITATGNDDGVDTYKTLLKPDQAQFIFASTKFMSSKKHLFVTWVGANAPPAHRGRSTLYRTQLYNFIDTILKLHGEIQWMQPSADDFSIVSREEYAHKLTGSKLRSDVEETS